MRSLVMPWAWHWMAYSEKGLYVLDAGRFEPANFRHNPFKNLGSHRRFDPFFWITPDQINMTYALVRMEHVVFDPLRCTAPESLVHLVTLVAPEQVSLREEIKAHINIGRYVTRIEPPPSWEYSPQPSCGDADEQGNLHTAPLKLACNLDRVEPALTIPENH